MRLRQESKDINQGWMSTDQLITYGAKNMNIEGLCLASS